MILVLLTAVLLLSTDRTEDREKIRAHIDRIFQAFIHKDAAELRATHDENWLGYLDGSRTMIRGIDGYMAAAGWFADPAYGMTGYKMREFDMIFQGDAAFVTFVADVDYKTPSGSVNRTLRIADFYVRRKGQWIQAGSDTDEHPETRQTQIEERMQLPQTLDAPARKALLEARETVWRSFFSNDRATLERLIPEETLTMDTLSPQLGNRTLVLQGAEGFAKSGAKLASLKFPSTEIQYYGNTAIVYSTYSYELEGNGQRKAYSGRVTEVFVFRKGQWVNPGWHMDSVKPGEQ